MRNAVLDKSGKIKYMIEMISYAVAAHHGLFDCADIEHTDIFSKKLSQVDDYEEATDEFCSIWNKIGCVWNRLKPLLELKSNNNADTFSKKSKYEPVIYFLEA